jgi:uncharacterized protein YhaN
VIPDQPTDPRFDSIVRAITHPPGCICAGCGKHNALNNLDSLAAEIATLKQQVERRDALVNRWAEAERVARQQADRLAALLGRIRQWDHLDGAHDGPFWKREIDAALAGREETG